MNFAIFKTATAIADAAEARLKEDCGQEAQVLVIVGSGGIGGGVAYRYRGGSEESVDANADRAYYLLTALVAFHRDQGVDISLECLQEQIEKVYALHTEQLARGMVRKREDVQ